ncbi:MAG TPA: DUF4279 domain-containing protein [Thermoanaerobaculia bacterium]|nr:DUF4279 domain-containing protein [Thermoanaerobaculia bacterium]
MTAELPVLSITFFIRGEDLNPALITTELSVFPDQAWRKGERIRTKTPSGNVVETPVVATEGGWKLFIPDRLSDSTFEEQLAYWSGFIGGNEPALTRISTSGFQMLFICYVSAPDGFVLEMPPEFLALAGRSQIAVELHFFYIE